MNKELVEVELSIDKEYISGDFRLKGEDGCSYKEYDGISSISIYKINGSYSFKELWFGKKDWAMDINQINTEIKPYGFVLKEEKEIVKQYTVKELEEIVGHKIEVVSEK